MLFHTTKSWNDVSRNGGLPMHNKLCLYTLRIYPIRSALIIVFLVQAGLSKEMLVRDMLRHRLRHDIHLQVSFAQM